MARLIFAFAVCGAVFAVPAAAQNGNPETPAPQSAPSEAAPTPAVPALPLPPPAPYDESLAQAPSPAPQEAPVAEVPSPAPQEAPVAEVPSPAPPDAPVAEAPSLVPHNPPVAQAPPPALPDAPVAQVPPPAPAEQPVAESKATDNLTVDSPPQNDTAAESKPENTEGRFTFSRMNEGYVRLDNRTGQVSFCSKRTVGWTCQLAPEDRGVLENEIARLQGENATLKKDFLTRGLPLPGAIKAEPPAEQTGRTFRLPTDPDLDRMKVLVEQVWRRLVEMISTLQKDVMKKS
jgi:hypothetical protein